MFSHDEHDVLVVSEVTLAEGFSHIERSTEEHRYLTRIKLSLPQTAENTAVSSRESTVHELTVDADGDLQVRRRSHASVVELTLALSIETSIAKVGLQLWSSSFLLADFILDNASLVLGKSVLELGAGVGLPSLCAALRGARTVHITDVLPEVLENCRLNVELNSCWLGGAAAVHVRRFDWTDDAAVTSLAELPDVVLAADTFYDADLTAAFVRTLERLLNSAPQCVCVIAFERRANFSLDTLSVSAASDYALQLLAAVPRIDLKPLSVDAYPKHVSRSYTANALLELYKCTLRRD